MTSVLLLESFLWQESVKVKINMASQKVLFFLIDTQKGLTSLKKQKLNYTCQFLVLHSSDYQLFSLVNSGRESVGQSQVLFILYTYLSNLNPQMLYGQT